MIALLSLSLAFAKPHPHNGKLTPFTAAPDAVSISDSDEERLKQGKPVLKQRVGGDGGEGVAVQYISASTDDVWDTILDYDNYKNWVKNVDGRIFGTEQAQQAISVILVIHILLIRIHRVLISLNELL